MFPSWALPCAFKLQPCWDLIQHYFVTRLVPVTRNDDDAKILTVSETKMWRLIVFTSFQLYCRKVSQARGAQSVCPMNTTYPRAQMLEIWDHGCFFLQILYSWVEIQSFICFRCIMVPVKARIFSNLNFFLSSVAFADKIWFMVELALEWNHFLTPGQFCPCLSCTCPPSGYKRKHATSQPVTNGPTGYIASPANDWRLLTDSHGISLVPVCLSAL